MLTRFGSIRAIVLAGMLGIPALVVGCCGQQGICAPVEPTCAPVAGGVLAAYQAKAAVAAPAVAPAPTLAKSPAPAPAPTPAPAPAKSPDVVSAAPADAEETAGAEVGVAETMTPSKPAAPARAGGSARLDEFERPENFSLVYGGLRPSELAHYGVGDHYDIAGSGEAAAEDSPVSEKQ